MYGHKTPIRQGSITGRKDSGLCKRGMLLIHVALLHTLERRKSSNSLKILDVINIIQRRTEMQKECKTSKDCNGSCRENRILTCSFPSGDQPFLFHSSYSYQLFTTFKPTLGFICHLCKTYSKLLLQNQYRPDSPVIIRLT